MLSGASLKALQRFHSISDGDPMIKLIHFALQHFERGLRAGWSGVRVRVGMGIFLLTPASIPAQRPTQPPVQLVPGFLFLGVKRPGREADHSPPSSAEVRSAWSYTSTPQYVLMAWCSVKVKPYDSVHFRDQ
jgi:hypothetical protein